MSKAGRVLLLTFWMLPFAAGLADDTQPSKADAEPLPIETPYVDSLLRASPYASVLPSMRPIDNIAHPNDWQQPLTRFSFRDSSTLVRVSNIRSLSLLTLAESDQSRLFLGVNEEGFLGVHLRAYSRNREERYFEMARLPYLKAYAPDSDSDYRTKD